MSRLRGLCFGAGYFSQFHYDAWSRLTDVEIIGICDLDESAAKSRAEQFGILQTFTDPVQALEQSQPDFVDIITPPNSHEALVRLAAELGLAVICQKPLAPTFQEAERIVHTCESHDVRFMVHENFRFQPWYREIRRVLAAGTPGTSLHSLTFRSRPGDGWGVDAYLGRQPYFREMPRLLVHETGVHFIDTFRYLAGEISGVFANLRRLNPVINGEDCGLLLFEFESGAVGLWDANRFNESRAEDPRYTFGEMLVEGDGGSLRLEDDGRIMVQLLGQPEYEHHYQHTHRGFGGDCVWATQRHFIDALKSGTPFETAGPDYLRTLRTVEAIYQSAASGLPVRGLSVEESPS